MYTSNRTVIMLWALICASLILIAICINHSVCHNYFKTKAARYIIPLRLQILENKVRLNSSENGLGTPIGTRNKSENYNHVEERSTELNDDDPDESQLPLCPDEPPGLRKSLYNTNTHTRTHTHTHTYTHLHTFTHITRTHTSFFASSYKQILFRTKHQNIQTYFLNIN